MEKDKRIFNLRRKDIIYYPAVYYAPILAIFIKTLRRSELPSSAIFFGSLLFLLPFLIFNIIEAYLFINNKRYQTSTDRKTLFECWVVFLGCIVMCGLAVIL